MKKILVIAASIAALITMPVLGVLAADNPVYHADADKLQKRLDVCDATAKEAFAFKEALESGLFSCSGLGFDAQQPNRPESLRLYNRYCVKPLKK
jgi:hypothetical protein